MSFVSVKNVRQKYGNRSILERVNVTIEEGDFISIVEAYGCGKSTFLRMLLGIERTQKGEISIEGGPTAREPNLERGVVFQRYSVFPHITVLKNLIAGEGFRTTFGWLKRAKRKAAEQSADQMLQRIGLSHVAHQYPAMLSGGIQQRLAIVQAMTAKPRIPLLDEPFGALDPGTRVQMNDFLMARRDETNMTVFMVSHDLDEAFKLGDRVLVLTSHVGIHSTPTNTAPMSLSTLTPATVAFRSREFWNAIPRLPQANPEHCLRRRAPQADFTKARKCAPRGNVDQET